MSSPKSPHRQRRADESARIIELLEKGLEPAAIAARGFSMGRVCWHRKRLLAAKTNEAPTLRASE